MIEFVAIIVVIAVLLSNRSLASRINALEAKMKTGAAPAVGVAPATQPQSVVSQTVVTGGMEEYLGPPRTVIPVVPTYVAPQPKQPDPLETFGAWLKDDWLMKLGGFLFIIGCGWFVSYAFANNWIGPVGRISLGIIAGVLVMVLGFWRMMRYPSQGGVFMALGAGMTILSIFAGRSVYHFFTPASAIVFDFIVAAFVSFASYKFNLRSLALTAQILAFVAPILTAGQTDPAFLFSYLIVISLATLFLAGLRGWRVLILSSLVFVGLYSLPYIFAPQGNYGNIYSANAPIILNFAYMFAMIYLLSGMFAVMKKGVEDTGNEIGLAVLNGFFLFMWIHNVAGKEWQTLIFSAWAIVFAIGSFIAFRFSSKLHPFYAYGSVAVAFIAAATSAQLHGEALTLVFSIEVLMLVVTVLLLTKSVGAASSTLLLFFAPILLSFTSMTRYLVAKELFTKDFFVLLILSLSLIVAGRLIGSVEKENPTREGSSQVWPSAVILGTVYLWFIIWCFLHISLPDAPDMATFITLVIYTIAGLWAYFVGLYSTDTARRVYGAVLLIFVVARLLLVDVWAMALSGRVITFFAIGILLMSTAFLTKRKTSAQQ